MCILLLNIIITYYYVCIYIFLLYIIITYYYYLLLFMGRARARPRPMCGGRGAVRPRGRGGRPPRAPQRGPITRGITQFKPIRICSCDFPYVYQICYKGLDLNRFYAPDRISQKSIPTIFCLFGFFGESVCLIFAFGA